jgi:hypothetical protein
MSDWLHNLPVTWMALVAFAANYLLAAIIYVVVNVMPRGRARPGLQGRFSGPEPRLQVLLR